MMKLNSIMMMAAAAAVVAAPAFAEGTTKHHSKHHAKTVSSTMPAETMAPATVDSNAAHVEKAPEGMGMTQSSESKASGNIADPNSGDPSAPPR